MKNSREKWTKTDIIRGLGITIVLWSIIILYALQLPTLFQQLLFIPFVCIFMFGVPIFIPSMILYELFYYVKYRREIND